ncbi:hypothetical protein Tsubulata_030037 [Turnera subulata]|uniref:TFIIE beta domain-containing protein n=1 Tax=Turnera subulata TaxID=218843 RepID=A0A9Q0GJ95_9ROSI|nr:hypothetical protein Tsubulata_030037 [Turnera subulata]
MVGLQQQLTKLTKQQEKCQTTISTLASRPGQSKSSALPPAAGARTTAPAVKFSIDTERLQHINSIRKAPVGAQIKRVIDLLKETRQALTPEQINEACYVDLNSNKAVFDSLKNNCKASYDGRRFAYKATHDIKDKAQLLTLIQKYPEGIHVLELVDAYPAVMEDLKALRAEGYIWLLLNSDSQEGTAYPNDQKMVGFKVDDDLKLLFRGDKLHKEMGLKVDDDLKELCRDDKLLKDMLKIEEELEKNHMKPATNTAKRVAAALVQGIVPKQNTKKKQGGITKRTKLTNAHLPELFQNLGS